VHVRSCHDIAITIEILIICPVKEIFMNSCCSTIICSDLVVCREAQNLLDLDPKLIKKSWVFPVYIEMKIGCMSACHSKKFK
jgi:hypothetical protein